MKKSQLSVEAVQRKVQDFSSSMSTLTNSRNKINTLDKNLEVQKAKFDAANQSLAQEKAKMADWEQEIVHCNEEKLRIASKSS